MREILFRGKQVNDGMWIQGYLFQFWGRAYILWGMTNDTPTMHEVKPETIGQFTGLTDKNGVKIFEGDILHQAYHKENDFVVVFADGGFKVSYLYESQYHNVGFGCTTFCQQNLTGNSFGKYAVIGNIHDNPELLT